ncbi:hypothetical protein AVEN_18524-1 [Araneus ventricosus]|uniref:Uncharacterized protein n=1 Tax=Araneus ventricosus TaxID=182803 RepID=A0A4Y2TSH5_ARAVE|nr:hypothetical protein AVEN_18524-1 [Araneus ventricosus]
MAFVPIKFTTILSFPDLSVYNVASHQNLHPWEVYQKRFFGKNEKCKKRCRTSPFGVWDVETRMRSAETGLEGSIETSLSSCIQFPKFFKDSCSQTLNSGISECQTV